MIEKEKAQNDEIHTIKEQTIPQKPNNIMIKKIRGKTFVTEIYFDPNSKDTFQDKLLKVVKSEWKGQEK
ncbi:transposon-encoded TnpW family protein [Streptococcus anginosus]|uniref:transposon-encoded TnpW family protein n=1 Tax=Streptococcus anginosus TaxID=1328 RepID=UPI0029C13883|nr:transposon-encoded TnpW family protein [Streptococcus anginosus]MDX5006698.1 transposon-encoded TnpW family protein [Streptococcus anginosus]MDX5054468.1 transposon-encoded TnpW family protein [Streptococcus anginosus]MDX5056808.1 transposon-encoded TnpW family protein [Streptococcus anginosus]MDX5058690.1 transposon-encoded TnpW family protein [Streptococcus anginosus]